MAGPTPDAEIAGGVTGFEVVAYALPFKEPYVTALGTLKRREMVLLRVHTGIGVVGLGEAVPMSLRGGRSLDRVVGELRQLAHAFADATKQERTEILRKVFFELSAPSRCAIFTAWHDMAGKAQDMPAWETMAADRQESAAPIECNATLSAGEPAQVAEQALLWAENGFESFKLKLGLAHDVDQVSTVRRAIGSEAKLRVDANGVWGPGEAVSKLEKMAAFHLELVEQPCASLEELAEVRRQVDVPVVADETVSTPEEAERAVSLGACDYVTLKLSKIGGQPWAQGIASIVPSYLSSALDGPVGIAAAAHTAQALYPPLAPDGSYSEHHEGGRDPGVAHGLATQRLFSDTIASRECELRDGFLHLPEGPGLGVEIDDAALERHRL